MMSDVNNNHNNKNKNKNEKCIHRYVPSNGYYVCINCGECSNELKQFDKEYYNIDIKKQGKLMLYKDIEIKINAILATYISNNKIPMTWYNNNFHSNRYNLVIDIAKIIRKIKPVREQIDKVIKIILCMVFHRQNMRQIYDHMIGCQNLYIKVKYNEIMLKIMRYEMDINELRNLYNPIMDLGNNELNELKKKIFESPSYLSHSQKITKIKKEIENRKIPIKIKREFKEMNNFNEIRIRKRMRNIT